MRKYTNKRHHLLTSDIYFPAYYKVVEQRKSIILRNIIQLYPNPGTPVGATYHKHNTTDIHSTEVCLPYLLLQL